MLSVGTVSAVAVLLLISTVLHGCGGGAATTAAPSVVTTAAPGVVTTAAAGPTAAPGAATTPASSAATTTIAGGGATTIGPATTTGPTTTAVALTEGAPPWTDYKKVGFRSFSWGSLYLTAQSCMAQWVPSCAQIKSSDIAADWAEPIWNANGGRGDLLNMKEMGANTVRLYGNDPRVSKKKFFDYARTLELQVVEGFTGYMYNEADGYSPVCATASRKKNCYQAMNETYDQVLTNGGFLENGYYHNAITIINLANEPDFYGENNAVGGILPNSSVGVPNYLEAMVMAFDGFLSAEKKHQVKPWTNGELPKITATWSFAQREAWCKPEWGTVSTANQDATPPGECGPGYMYMVQFAKAIADPKKYLKYTPVNNIKEAYDARWINTIQLFVDSAAVWNVFLKGYMGQAILKDTPVVATEWQGQPRKEGQLGRDLEEFDRWRSIPERSGFWGVSVFEYSVSYHKDGAERAFGLLALGPQEIFETKQMCAQNPDETMDCDEGGKTGKGDHPINCLVNMDADYLNGLLKAWGGNAPSHGLCPALPTVPALPTLAATTTIAAATTTTTIAPASAAVEIV